MTKKLLMSIPYFFLWVIYVLMTMKERNMYLVSKEKGMKCVDSKDVILGKLYTFNTNEKPKRDYLTWKEFWKARGY